MRYRPGVGLLLDSGVKLCGGARLSLSPSGQLGEGLDSEIHEVWPPDAPEGRGLTSEERAEIGVAMARHWLRWAGLSTPPIALTVRQPFADAIIHGGKFWENRTQAGPRAPTWMAIAAAKELFEERSLGVRQPAPAIGHPANEEPAPNSPQDVGGAGWDKTPTLLKTLRHLWPECPPLEDMTRQAIVGLAHYTGSHPWTPGRYSSVLWATGPVVWEFDRVLALPTPLPHRGMPGLHRVDDYNLPPLFEVLRTAGVHSTSR